MDCAHCKLIPGNCEWHLMELNERGNKNDWILRENHVLMYVETIRQDCDVDDRFQANQRGQQFRRWRL